MSQLRFDIRYADGKKEIATVDGERALIGNGAHCDIRLPLDQAAYEHVAVEVVGGTVRVESKAEEPAATVNGLPFTTMPMTADVPLKIGATRIFVTLGEGDFDGPVVQKKNEQTSPLMKVLGVVVVAAGAWMLLTEPETEDVPAPAQIPELFDPTPTVCPQMAPDQALSFADEKFAIAEGKRARSPFAPKDGVEAINKYELARACFRQGGDAQSAAEADQDQADLRRAITLDFRARRVRLEHFMAVGDYDLAKKDVAVLLSLTNRRLTADGKPNPYVAWLGQQAQIIKQRATKK